MSKPWHMTLAKGGTFVRTLIFTDDDDVLINTDDWTFFATLSPHDGRGVSVSLNVEKPQTGSARIKLDPEVSALLSPGRYFLSVDWQDALGDRPEDEIRGIVDVSVSRA